MSQFVGESILSCRTIIAVSCRILCGPEFCCAACQTGPQCKGRKLRSTAATTRTWTRHLSKYVPRDVRVCSRVHRIHFGGGRVLIREWRVILNFLDMKCQNGFVSLSRIDTYWEYQYKMKPDTLLGIRPFFYFLLITVLYYPNIYYLYNNIILYLSSLVDIIYLFHLTHRKR